MSREARPFAVVRPLEIVNRAHDSELQHIGRAAASGLMIGWNELQKENPRDATFQINPPDLPGDYVVLIHRDEVAAAVTDPNTQVIDPKALDNLYRKLARHADQIDTTRHELLRARHNDPETSTAPFIITPAMFDGAYEEPAGPHGVRIAAQVLDLNTLVRGGIDPDQSLYAERAHLLNVMETETGHRPGPKHRVSIPVGELSWPLADTPCDQGYTVCGYLAEAASMHVWNAQFYEKLAPAVAGPLELNTAA